MLMLRLAFTLTVVDMNFLFTSVSLLRMLFCNADVLFEALISAVRGDGSVAGFVTFPSDARSLIR